MKRNTCKPIGMFLIHRCLIIFWSFHKYLLNVYYVLEPNIVFDPQHQHAAQNFEGCVFILTLLALWKEAYISVLSSIFMLSMSLHFPSFYFIIPSGKQVKLFNETGKMILKHYLNFDLSVFKSLIHHLKIL